LEYHTAYNFKISSSSSTPPNEGETIYRSAIRDNIRWYDNPNLSFSLFENNIEIIVSSIDVNSSPDYMAEVSQKFIEKKIPVYLLEINR
jgi:hypothetical protein